MTSTSTAPPTTPALRTFNACMPEKELAALDTAAKAAHVTRSYAIRAAVRLCLKQQARG